MTVDLATLRTLEQAARGPRWRHTWTHEQGSGHGIAPSECPKCIIAALADELDGLRAEVERLRSHILDIDAHATPYGDIPDDPGWVGSYLLTAGALHRALGTIGHTAPSCQAEAEIERLRGERDEAQADAQVRRVCHPCEACDAARDRRLAAATPTEGKPYGH